MADEPESIYLAARYLQCSRPYPFSRSAIMTWITDNLKESSIIVLVIVDVVIADHVHSLLTRHCRVIVVQGRLLRRFRRLPTIHLVS